MIRLTTYADERMTKSLELCMSSAKNHGVENVWPYQRYMICGEPGMADMYKEFYNFNKDILDQERGSGYWLWKPYIIYRSMLQCKEGDILIYSDAGVEFVNNVSHIIERMDEDIFFFTNGWPHVEWCKMDCIDAINDVDLEYTKCGVYAGKEYEKNKQVQASVIFFKVNQKTKDFVKEWLLYCQMPGFIDDSPSELINYPTFAEHRHDQAILTCLQIKHGYKLHWWPTQYAMHIKVPGDDYPVIFNHHRKRNNEW